ncbi:hypothetical protein L485_14330 [Sphingobium baderi LL03]|uniref:Uncharacterized protein n=1 Tax=Sphingobium baderi LL03 TaxID=1114964 RepID=T0GHD6_9SPHN|nr:hypothetical protein L485_14330 [Sphingobium baderi LL03]
MEIDGRLAAGFMRYARICQQLDSMGTCIPIRVSDLIPAIHRLWMKNRIC